MDHPRRRRNTTNEEDHPSASSDINDDDNSLLAKAMDIPYLHDHPLNASSTTAQSDETEFPPLTPPSGNLTTPMSASSNNDSSSLLLPLHSDFTLPISNIHNDDNDLNLDPPSNTFERSPQTKRRSVLGLGTKYHRRTSSPRTPSSSTRKQPQNHHPTSSYQNGVETTDSEDPQFESLSTLLQKQQHPQSPSPSAYFTSASASATTPDPYRTSTSMSAAISPLTPAHDYLIPRATAPASAKKKKKSHHETTHAQSLLLGLSFMMIWSPNNCMAPNLTEMMLDFQMTSTEQRDLYLGSYCALAVGVVSLPISAAIGLAADFYSRKWLFVATGLCSAVAAAATGLSAPSFPLLFLARLVNGGCMSGSVPVAFSLLGDLFDASERNAASSGLTAMMGLGIIAGQVYAGITHRGWAHPFYVSSILTVITSLLVAIAVREPIRGGKEQVLQEMIRNGSSYDRRLTYQGFVHAMRFNASNRILLWQSFCSSVPWGIIFVFLNDYLSQEKGFSVPDATFMVMLFGVGCAIGGVLGGFWGQLLVDKNTSYLPLFMAATTALGILPFLGLLNSNLPNPKGILAMGYSLFGGLIASLPSVNVRPCIINVNPPETRGAALTAANLIVGLARGIGPSCITLMGSVSWHLSRQSSFNLTLSGFWIISSVQLLYLAKTLPQDQQAMEMELARYAADQTALLVQKNGNGGNDDDDDDPDPDHASIMTSDNHTAVLEDAASLVSGSCIEEPNLAYLDGTAARQSLQFVQKGWRELQQEVKVVQFPFYCPSALEEEDEAPSEDHDDSVSPMNGMRILEDDHHQVDSIVSDDAEDEDLERKREAWWKQQRRMLQVPTLPVNEQTPLVPKGNNDK